MNTSKNLTSEPTSNILGEIQEHFNSGRFDKAYDASLKLPPRERQHPKVVDVINRCLRKIRLTRYSKMIEDDLITMIESEETNDGTAQQKAGELLQLKSSRSKGTDHLTLEYFASDALFRKYLEVRFIRNPSIEPTLIALRRQILLQSLSNSELNDNLTDLAIAIAWQNWHNEYVHPISSEEQEILENLEGLLSNESDKKGFTVHHVEGLLLLCAMYKPLGLLSSAKTLAELNLSSWPSSLTSISRQTLYGMEEELKYTKQIISLGSINDKTSKKVQAQYEENPYPRWARCIKLPAKENYFDNLWSTLRQNRETFSHSRSSSNKKANILVAGCGTGRHPINLAFNFHAQVTAIDITRRSLGYAAMMSQKYKVTNIDYIHMDLMECNQLNQTFDAIECSGVLHHMKEPEVGLKSLLEVIKPSGLIKLGLYSSTARESVTNVRNAYLKSNMTPSLDNIRAVRQALMSKGASKDYKAVTLFGDFYATSTCRDLLFHAQEHTYNIIKIEELLNLNNLKFLGFIFTNQVILDNFINKYDKGSLRDLRKWDEFEKANPDTFVDMYQFYCAAPGPSTESY